MLRYQASFYSDACGIGDSDVHLQPSTIASSNGLRAQQSRIIRRQPASGYKSVPTCRLTPRRRYFVMENQKSINGVNAHTSFPGPDYLKRMKENYETGKIIYIRRSIPGLKNNTARMTSTVSNSIRSATYHNATMSSLNNGKVTIENSGNGPKYVFRLPKNDFNNTSKSDENTSNMYIPAYEPPNPQYSTVPACMSMGGEYTYEEEVEEGEENSNELSDDLLPADGFHPSPPSSGLESPADEDGISKCDSVVRNSISARNMPTNSALGNSNAHNYKFLPMKNLLQPTKYTCTHPDCFWRGPTDMALRKHMQIHDPKQPVMYSKSNSDPMKVQLVQPKPKGVKCSECDTFAYSRPLLLRHMHDAHGIEAPLIRRTFANREMLQSWLDSLRETHAVEFVVSSGSKKWGRGLQVHYLTCSRSGDQKERPNKKYVRPPRPSIKCGRNCMAYLKIKQNPTVSELQIEGCLHHSGHEIDHTRMMLEPNELSSIGLIVDAVNKGLDVMNNVETLRSFLGNSGRFRLVSDNGLIEQMSTWFNQYHRAMAEYLNDGNHFSVYRGSGALTLPISSLSTYGSIMSMKSQTENGRRINLPKQLSRTIKQEPDYEHSKAVPIRYNNLRRGRNNLNNANSNTNDVYDEGKVKIEIEDEDMLAAQNLIKDEFANMKDADIFDSPMIGGEEIRVNGVTKMENVNEDTLSIDDMLSFSTAFRDDGLCGVDDLTTDFNCGLDDAEFNELLGIS